MKQTMEEGVSEVLSSVVQDVDLVVGGNGGAHVLQDLLSAPWLSALLKMYDSLLQFQRLRPSPLLPFSSAVSHEILCGMSKIQRPSAEARELFRLLCSPHMKALLRSHDTVAQQDFGPVLEPLPDDLPEDEEAVRIVCLVKNNQPLWGSLHREPQRRRAWSGEEKSESVARLLPFPHGDSNRPFTPRYQSTGRCCVCPQAWNTGLNQSAPSIFSPAPYSESTKRSDSIDEYSFPPPPVPVCSLSLPNSPALCKKTSTYEPQYHTIPAPKTSYHSLPCSPAMQRSITPQEGSTHPTQQQQNSFMPGHLDDRENVYCNISQVQMKQVNQQRLMLRKQRSIDELRSVVQKVATTFSNEDFHHLGHKMAAATELMTDNVEENAQALSLLVEVVDKLQGLIVASKSQTSSPQNRSKLNQWTSPLPPRRVSSLSPKIVRKAPTMSRQLSTSSSSSSCSTSSNSLHFYPDVYKPSRRSDPKKSVTFGGRGNGQVRLNNGAVSRAPSSDQYDCNTSCLTTKKKKKK